MLGHGGQRHLEGVGDIGHGHVVFQKHGQNGAPRWIGQRGKDQIKRGSI